MLSIQTNIAALSAQNALTTTNNNLQKSMERLSSGFRINHAADDAAGLAISEKMQAQIGGLNQAVRNANDGASMIQTAEGALDQVQTMMVRMRNLAVQAASDTNGPQERADINVEIQQLQSEIDNISQRTTFNGLKLLNGALVTQQDNTNSTVLAGTTVGTGSITGVDVTGGKANTTYGLTYANNTLTMDDGNGNTSYIDMSGASMVAAGGSATLNFTSLGVKITIANADTTNPISGAAIGGALDGLAIVTKNPATDPTAGNSVTLQTGADANGYNTTTVSLLDTRLTQGSAADMTALATAIGAFNTASDLQANPAGPTDTQATNLISAIDTANAWISSQRAQLGAAQNRLGYAAASLTTTAQNVTAANSQIRDVDVAAETSQMSKSQILMQAGVSVLAQANQVQQLALKLLG
jgi:flagellin